MMKNSSPSPRCMIFLVSNLPLCRFLIPPVSQIYHSHQRHLTLIMAPTTRPKMSAPKSKRDDPEQSKLFIEKAREIGADEEKSVADELLGRLAKMPPEPHKEPKRGGKNDRGKKRSRSLV